MRVAINLLALCFLTAGTTAKTQTAYFPPGSLGPPSDGTRQWYSAELAGLKEPSLWQESKQSNRCTYRFLWLRSFNPAVSVRLDLHHDGSATLTAKVGNRVSNLDTRHLKIDSISRRRVTRDHVRAFLRSVQSTSFWTLPTRERTTGMEDGAEWIVEAACDGRYHMVDRWSPANGPVRQLGTELVFGLAGLPIPANAIY